MALGRPIPPLQLSREERETLERWVRRPKSAQALALRARVILACAQGKTNTAVAQQMHLAKPTVGKWRSRFVARRLDGLLDEPRPGAPREISDAAVVVCGAGREEGPGRFLRPASFGRVPQVPGPDR